MNDYNNKQVSTQDLYLSAYELASNEVSDREIYDPESGTVNALTGYLVARGADWASYDLNDLSRYEGVIEDFFGGVSL